MAAAAAPASATCARSAFLRSTHASIDASSVSAPTSSPISTPEALHHLADGELRVLDAVVQQCRSERCLARARAGQQLAHPERMCEVRAAVVPGLSAMGGSGHGQRRAEQIGVANVPRRGDRFLASHGAAAGATARARAAAAE